MTYETKVDLLSNTIANLTDVVQDLYLRIAQLEAAIIGRPVPAVPEYELCRRADDEPRTKRL